MSNDGQVVIDIIGDAKEYNKAIAGISATTKSQVSAISSALSSVGATLTKYITVPAAAAATAIGAIALVKGWDRLVAIDTARSKLVALRMDAATVEQVMTDALASVKGTSYGLGEAATAAASAVAAGIKPGQDLQRYLKLVGDAAAVSGRSMDEMGSIFGKVQTAQRAYMEELNMLADSGIPIYQWLAEEIGVTAAEVRDLASDGKVSSEQFYRAIEKNIGGAAKIIGETSIKGAIDNIWASISRIGANFLDAGGKGGGFFSQLKPLLVEFKSGLEDAESSAAQMGVAAGEAFTNVVKGVKDVVAWYKALSPEQQDLVNKLAMTAIAAGPVLLVAGKLLSVGQGIVATIKTVSGAFSLASAAISSGTSVVKANVTVTEGMDRAAKQAAKSQQLLNTAATVGKAALVGLAVAGIAIVIAKLVEMAAKQEEYVKATDGLVSATRTATTVNGQVASAYSNAGTKAKAAAADVDKLLQKQAALADTISDTNLTAQTSVSQLEGYKTTINELANQSGLGADNQARLKAAVEGVNGMLGTQYTVADALNGVIKDQEGNTLNVVDAINKAIEAKQKQIQVDAAAANATALLKARYEAEQAYARALSKEQDVYAEVNRKIEDHVELTDADRQAMEKATDDRKKAKGAIDSTSAAYDNETKKLEMLQQVQAGTADGYTKFINAHQSLNTVLSDSGQSLDTFQAQLRSTGVSTEALGKLSEEELVALAKAYDGSVDSITDKLTEFGIEVPNQGRIAADGWAKALSEGTQAAVSAAMEVTGLTLEQFKQAADAAGIQGDEAVTRFAQHLKDGRDISVAAALTVTGMTLDQFKKAASDAGVTGDDAVRKFANGLSEGKSISDAAAAAIGDGANAGMGDVDTYDSGKHLVENFAAGIAKARQVAIDAAWAVANSIANILKHSKPKEGPLSEGEELWGKHAIENFAQGMKAGIPEVEEVSDSVASAVADSFASATDPAIQAARKMMDEAYSAIRASISSSPLDAITIPIGTEDLLSGIGVEAALAGSAAVVNNITNNNYYIDGVDLSGDEAATQAAGTLWGSVLRAKRMGTV